MAKLNRTEVPVVSSEIPVEDLTGFVYAPNPHQGKTPVSKGSKTPTSKGKYANKTMKLTGAPLTHREAIIQATNPASKGTKAPKGTKKEQ